MNRHKSKLKHETESESEDDSRVEKYAARKKFKKAQDDDDTDEDEEENEDFEEDDYDEDEEEVDDEDEDDDDQGDKDEEDDDDDEDDDQEESDDDDDEKTEPKNSIKDNIQKELSSMSFEEIRKLQNNLGLKKFTEVMKKDQENDKTELKTFSRLNKNRPQELSSKKRVPIHRNIFQVKKREIIDPRFNSAFGEYKPEFFRKQYGFIHEMRKNEKDNLQKQLKEETDPKQIDQIKSAITRLKQQIKSFEESEKKETMKLKFKSEAQKDAKEGKRPHFINKSEQKILELAEKYKELKKSGKVEKFLAKKRKKQLSKDSKHLSKSEHIRFV